MNPDREIISSQQDLQTLKDPAEQERIKNQMELVMSKMQQVAQLLLHPAFDRFKRPNNENNVYWSIGLTPDMALTTDDELSYHHSLSFVQQSDQSGISLFMTRQITPDDPGGAHDRFLANPPLRDPITNEAITDIHLTYTRQAQEGGFLSWLFTPDSRLPQKISFEVDTFAEAPEFVASVDQTGDEVIPDSRRFMPHIGRKHGIYYYATPEETKKKQITFHRAFLERSDHLDRGRWGFPEYQTYPMTDEQCIQRIDALLGFVLPPLIQEAQAWNTEHGLPPPPGRLTQKSQRRLPFKIPLLGH